MQAQIRRTPVGHYILHCSLAEGAEAEAMTLPNHWTHIELDLGHLRILCALPEHPRQQDCTLADPRLSSWLRARVHAGKLAANQTVALHAVYEGVYCVETQSVAAHNPVAEPLSVEQPTAASLDSPALDSPVMTRPRPSVAVKLLPRPIRQTTRQSARALAAKASA